MALAQPATNPVLLEASDCNSPRGVASYAGALTEMRLRQALAQAEALLREKDLLIRAVLGSSETAAGHLAGLTQRQREIMNLMFAGKASKDMAADLGISQRTGENHRAAIMRKTGSACLPALGHVALAAGLSPDLEAGRQASADLPAPGPDAANRSSSAGNTVVAFRDAPRASARPGASVANSRVPVGYRSK